MTVKYRLTETGNVLHSAGEHTATVSNEFSNYFKVRLIDDDDDEADSTVTINHSSRPQISRRHTLFVYVHGYRRR